MKRSITAHTERKPGALLAVAVELPVELPTALCVDEVLDQHPGHGLQCRTPYAAGNSRQQDPCFLAMHRSPHNRAQVAQSDAWRDARLTRRLMQ